MPLGAALLLLLWLVVLATRARGGPPAQRDVGRLVVSSLLLAYLSWLFLLVSLVELVLLLVVVVRRDGRWPRRNRSHWTVLRLLLVAWLLLFVAGRVRLPPWLRAVLEHGLVGPATPGQRADRIGRVAGRVAAVPHAVGSAAVVAVGLAGAALLLAAALTRARTAAPRAGRPAEVTAGLEEAIDRSLARLEAGAGDARTQVIAAYATMEQVLGAHGLPRPPADAPLEYLARVLDVLDVRPEAIRRLTDLFEHARFSQHEVDEAMRREAIAALRAVRADLATAAGPVGEATRTTAGTPA